MATFNVYDNEKSIFPSFSTLLLSLLGNAEIGKIGLEYGNVVEIQEGSVTLYNYQGVGR